MKNEKQLLNEQPQGKFPLCSRPTSTEIFNRRFQDYGIAKNVYILEIDYENVSKNRYWTENMVLRNYTLLSILLIEQLYNYKSGKGLKNK